MVDQEEIHILSIPGLRIAKSQVWVQGQANLVCMEIKLLRLIQPHPRTVIVPWALSWALGLRQERTWSLPSGSFQDIEEYANIRQFMGNWDLY